jgi:ATP-binding cassette subfamily B protein
MHEKQEFHFAGAAASDRRSPGRWVLWHALQQWPLLTLGILGALGNAATASAQPVLFGKAVELMQGTDPDTKTLLLYAAGVAGAALLRVVVQFARSASFEFVAQRVERDVRDELYRSLLGKSMTFHSLQPVGDTMARATGDVRQVNIMFSPGLNYVIGSIMFLFFPLILAPRYHPQLIATPLVFVLLYVVTLRLYLRVLGPATEAARSRFGELNTRLSESLDGIELVKGSGREDEERERFRESANHYRDAYVRQGDIEAWFLPMLLFSLALGFGLMHALWLYRAGQLNLGQVIGYFGVLMMLDFPTFASMFAYSRLATGLAASERVLELINRRTDLDQNRGGYEGELHGEVEFRDVTFAYPDGGEVLQGISFRAEPGQTVAIVGQTGSGKTSLVKLINRIHDVSGGAVLVDGVDVREWHLEALRQRVSIIEQDIFLFSKSVRENIAFGKPGASEEEILAAAQAAQADEFIREFAEGYDTVIGERGVSLSGGQRQRLALARAFLTDPAILILDDSTSAVDSATEDHIQQAIAAAASGRTTFIITHRLSQIRWADLILVVRAGRLDAAGTHEQLMATSDAYRRLFQD